MIITLGYIKKCRIATSRHWARLIVIAYLSVKVPSFTQRFTNLKVLFFEFCLRINV